MKRTYPALFFAIVFVATILIAKTSNHTPKGWHFNAKNTSEYEVGTDNSTFESGSSSAYIISSNTTGKEFGNLMQAISAKEYLGKRLQLTGWIKTENVTGRCQMWMRIDGKKQGEMLSFDNMGMRPITGTTDWKQYSIVLDVPENSRLINYGVLIVNTGKVWIDNFQLKEVDKSVRTTNMLKENTLPTSPVNLDFEE